MNIVKNKIYGTNENFNELREWLRNNEYEIEMPDGTFTLPSNWLYNKNYKQHCRPISCFPYSVDRWLLRNCPLNWLTDKIREQHGIFKTISIIQKS